MSEICCPSQNLLEAAATGLASLTRTGYISIDRLVSWTRTPARLGYARLLHISQVIGPNHIKLGQALNASQARQARVSKPREARSVT